MNIKVIAICSSMLWISACHQKNNDADRKHTDTVQMERSTESLVAQTEIVSAASQDDQGEEWLRSIFRTKSSDKYFPDYNVEEKLCTKRFQEFIVESGEIYGPSNLTDEELPAAEKKYKAKWSGTYPIEGREMWLFGRGNGDIGELAELKINKIKHGVYRLFIDYGSGIKTQNEVTLLSENGDYKIDYCKTDFLN